VKVTVRLIGAPRVALGFRERELEVAEGATVADVVSTLVEGVGPKARAFLLDPRGRGYSVVFVVDGASARAETPLAEGSVIIAMPATAGG
jgi:molybdopterin converting factor small subunit